MRILFPLVLAIFFLGCVSNPVPLSGAVPVINKKEKASSVQEVNANIGDSNIIIIRRYAAPTAFPVSVRIDDIKVASLGQRKYTAISLPSGSYKFVAKWPFIATQLPIEFTLDVNGTSKQYIELLGEVDVVRTRKKYVGARKLDSNEGAEYIAKCCKYTPAKNSTPIK